MVYIADNAGGFTDEVNLNISSEDSSFIVVGSVQEDMQSDDDNDIPATQTLTAECCFSTSTPIPSKRMKTCSLEQETSYFNNSLTGLHSSDSCNPSGKLLTYVWSYQNCWPE